MSEKPGEGAGTTQPHSCQCKRPPNGKEGRNLVVCIDGTSNQFGPKNTNVIELYSQLDKDESQLTYYNSGIGTYAEPSWKSLGYWKQVIDNKIDLAIAWNFEKIVLRAYRWLADNYQDGDVIFLFGFSRGAYQVRTLAGMINEVGLIHKGNEEQIPFAYELYAKVGSRSNQSRISSPSKSTERPGNRAGRFKQTFSRPDVRVHFIGAWDTVSSIGIIRGKNLPGTASPDHVCFFRHALALDERRVKFLPEYARGGVMVGDRHHRSDVGVEKNRDSNLDAANVPGPTSSKEVELEFQQPSGERPHIKEVWFAGTHSDIGGGNVINDDLDRRHPAFLWMSYETISAGLRLKASNVEWKWDELDQVHESLTFIWRLLEYLPLKRLTYRDPDSHTLRLHRCRGRKIQPGQRIHASVAFCGKSYNPRAQFSDQKTMDWRRLVGQGDRSDLEWTKGWEDRLEMDIFNASAAETTIQRLGDAQDPTVWVHRLTIMTWSDAGGAALRRVDLVVQRLLDAIQRHEDVNIRVAIADAVAYVIADSLDLFIEAKKKFEAWNIDEPFFRKFLCDVKPTRRKLEMLRVMIAEDAFRHKMLSEDIVEILDQRIQSDGDALVSTMHLLVELIKHEDSHHMMFESHVFSTLFNRLEHCGKYALKETINFILWIGKLGSQTGVGMDYRIFGIIVATCVLCGSELGMSIVAVLAKSAKHNNLRRTLLDSNVIPILVTNLTESDRIVRRAAVQTLSELAKHDDLRHVMLDSNVVTIVIAKLGGGDEDFHQSVTQALVELAEHNDLRRVMLDSNLIAILSTKLGDKSLWVCQAVVHALAELAKHDDLRRVMLDSNLIAILVTKLENKFWQLRQATVRALAELGKHDDSHRIMLDSNLISKLVAKLGDKSWCVRQAVVDALAELAKHNDLRRVMLDSNLTVLIAKLGNKFWQVCHSAVQALLELAKHDDSRRVILDSNFVAILVTKLGDNNEDVRQSVVETLVELAKHDDSRRVMLDSNLINPLVTKLGDKSWQARHSAVQALAELAKHDVSRHIILDSQLVALIAKLESTFWQIRHSAIRALAELAKHDDSRCVMLDSNRRLIATLVTKLGDNSRWVLQAVVQALTELAKHEDSCHAMLASNIVDILITKLGDSDEVVRQSVADALAKLAEQDDLRHVMLESNLVAILVTHQGDRSPWCRRSIVQALAELAKHDDSRRVLLDSDLIAILIAKLGDKSRWVRQVVVQALAELAKHDDSRPVMLGSNLIAVLITNLGDSDEAVCQSVVQALAELAKHDDSRRALLEPDTITSLIINPGIAGQINLVSVLVDLATHVEDSEWVDHQRFHQYTGCNDYIKADFDSMIAVARQHLSLHTS